MFRVIEWSSLSFISLTLVLTGLFSSNEQAVAQDKTLHIGDKKSLVIGCFTVGYVHPADHTKLRPDESKTIECESEYPDPKCKHSPDFCWDSSDRRVFWCDHDNWLIIASYADPMSYGDYWKVTCR